MWLTDCDTGVKAVCCPLELREGHAAVRGRTGVDGTQPAGRPLGGAGAVRGILGTEGIVAPWGQHTPPLDSPGVTAAGTCHASSLFCPPGLSDQSIF